MLWWQKTSEKIHDHWNHLWKISWKNILEWDNKDYISNTIKVIHQARQSIEEKGKPGNQQKENDLTNACQYVSVITTDVSDLSSPVKINRLKNPLRNKIQQHSA